MIMVYLVGATPVTLESSDSGASNVEDSAMDTGKCSMHTYWRASEASETLSGVYKFELVRYIYMYGGTYAIIVAHAMHT